eukprot:CAMPEP_0171780124 /NCGR_PEP_ID=MMETSP0991-20121206/59421_1 /TAXON_ID=483369 /ORGANISM="non described non described, Strain CCMP2098" /LENGTH=75 /DNA_ID=CAMNT_0012387431 /DNA_START=189 /DNA_END=412 /DNA_ORIENTATION=-
MLPDHSHVLFDVVQELGGESQEPLLQPGTFLSDFQNRVLDLAQKQVGGERGIYLALVLALEHFLLLETSQVPLRL